MIPESAVLEDVRFLVRSPNRLAVLTAIRDEPRPRQELRGVTDASRVTLSRILRDFEDREWIDHVDGRYRRTPRGAVVASELARVFSNLDAVENLGETLSWLPVERFEFELGRLADATVVTATDNDLTAPITWTADRVRGAARVRNVAPGISSEVVDAYLEAAENDGRSLETVLFDRVTEHVREDANLRRKVIEMIESDRITVRRYDGDALPILVSICDDAVVICGRPEPTSVPQAVDSTDPEVLAWAASYVESVRADARPLDVEAFTP